MFEEKNYNVLTAEKGVPIKAWTKGVQLEDQARQQLLNVAQLPFIFKWVAAMPDVHCATRRNHAAHRRADAPMHVWHRCHPLKDERQLRDIQKLLTCGVLERNALGPGLDRYALVGLEYVVSCVCHNFVPFKIRGEALLPQGGERSPRVHA